MYVPTKPGFYDILMDGIHDMVFVIRVEETKLTYAFINRAAMEMTGLSEDIIGKDMMAVYPKEEAAIMMHTYENVAQEGVPSTFEDSFVSKDGKAYYTQTTLTPLFDSAGRCKQIVAVVKDISGQKMAEFDSKATNEKLMESRQIYQSLFEYNADVIYTLNLAGVIVTGNGVSQSVTGYSPHELKGKPFQILVSSGDHETIENQLEGVLQGEFQSCHVSGKGKYGNMIRYAVKFSPMITDGNMIGIFAIMKDVTDEARLIGQFRESENRFRIIAENSSDVIALIDANGLFSYVSPSCKDMVAYNYKNFIGKPFYYQIHPEDVERMKQVFRRSIEEKAPCKDEYRQKHRTHGWVWSELHGTPVFDEKNQFIHMVVVTRDVSLRKEYEVKLKHFAYHDPLTTLPNRRLFKKRLKVALEGSRTNGAALSVIMMDIDHFKRINDSKGHDAGDEVIAEFGRRIRGVLRENDMVARLGGDEFVILLPETSAGMAESMAKHIQQVMREPWFVGDNEIDVTASIGVAILTGEDATEYDMLKNADLALYEAKEAGRDGYMVRKVFS